MSTPRTAIELAVPVEPQQQQQQEDVRNSQRGSVRQLRNGSSGPITGLLQAHSDFVQWWKVSHGSLFDKQMTIVDANGIKREYVGYGLVVLIVLLLFTRLAPLLGQLICIAYPIVATLSILRGQSPDRQQFLIYWSVFGILCIFDFQFAEYALYWLTKDAICVFLYLPQTQGAQFVYSLVIEPVVNIVDTQLKKLV